jgi:hypothetical protein
MKTQLPATYDDALALQMRDYLRERLKDARWGVEERQEANRLLLMTIADVGERNAAYVVDLATARGFVDAYEAASELVSRRLAAAQPLGASLEYFVNWLTLGRRPPGPEGRPRDWLLDYVVVLSIVDLKARFGANLYRSSSKRTSICAVVAEALGEARLKSVTEAAIRQIYERHGPPALPNYIRQGPALGVVRFTSS